MGLHLLYGHDILMGQVRAGFIYPVNFAEARCSKSKKVIFVVGANDYFCFLLPRVFVYPAPDDAFHLGWVLCLTIPLEGVL